MAAGLTLGMRLLTLIALLFSPVLVCPIIQLVTFQSTLCGLESSYSDSSKLSHMDTSSNLQLLDTA